MPVSRDLGQLASASLIVNRLLPRDRCDSVTGRVARPLILNLRVPHLSRLVTGGVFDFRSLVGNCESPFGQRRPNPKPRP
jgi:hypothetical protein